MGVFLQEARDKPTRLGIAPVGLAEAPLARFQYYPERFACIHGLSVPICYTWSRKHWIHREPDAWHIFTLPAMATIRHGSTVYPTGSQGELGC